MINYLELNEPWTMSLLISQQEVCLPQDPKHSLNTTFGWEISLQCNHQAERTKQHKEQNESIQTQPNMNFKIFILTH